MLLKTFMDKYGIISGKGVYSTSNEIVITSLKLEDTNKHYLEIKLDNEEHAGIHTLFGKTYIIEFGLLSKRKNHVGDILLTEKAVCDYLSIELTEDNTLIINPSNAYGDIRFNLEHIRGNLLINFRLNNGKQDIVMDKLTSY